MGLYAGHDGLVRLNRVLGVHLLGVHPGHSQCAMPQKALDVEQVQAIPDRLTGEGAPEGVGVAFDSSGPPPTVKHDSDPAWGKTQQGSVRV